jgi:hypothetical protein
VRVGINDTQDRNAMLLCSVRILFTIKLDVVMLNVATLSVVKLNVVMLSVVAPL